MLLGPRPAISVQQTERTWKDVMSIAVQLLKEQLLGQQLNVHEVAFLTLLQQNSPEEYRLAKEKAEKEIRLAGITRT
jgi:hypothetical protein